MYINNDFSRLEINLSGCLENYNAMRGIEGERLKTDILGKTEKILANVSNCL